jgi:FkbH-like protein
MTALREGSTQILVQSEGHAGESQAEHKTVKLLIWDLDNTLWRGTLLEDQSVRLRDEAKEMLALLDQRGILHSIASRNDHETAMRKLQEFGIAEYFLYPQINWNSKAANVETIVRRINVGMDTVAFIDDEPFEREEMRHAFSEVLVLDANALPELARRQEFVPPFITQDSARRRKMYQADLERHKAEKEFVGPKEDFLRLLNMKFTIVPAREDDLQRAEELTIRTHQLNTTGYTYSYGELNAFRESPNHLLLIAGLEDKFGDYGRIGLALVELGPQAWTVKLLLMSCRVMSRGVGTILINHILTLARDAGVRLRTEFRPNGKNRMMLVTYKLGGFREVEQSGELIIFEHDMQSIQPTPAWVELLVNGPNQATC